MSGLRVTGIEELIKEIENSSTDSTGIAQECVKSGIEVVTDEMRSKCSSLKVSEKATKKTQLRYCRQWEKDALLNELGYTPNRETGSVEDRKAGYDGYAISPTGKRVAVRAIANSINAGTSFMRKQPIFQPVIRASREQAIKKMQDTFNDELKKRGLEVQ